RSFATPPAAGGNAGGAHEQRAEPRPGPAGGLRGRGGAAARDRALGAAGSALGAARSRLAAAGSALADSPEGAQAAVETLARVLLRRYGVVFRTVLEQEAVPLPWRDLLRIYRRMEARGDLRGGRFVAGFSGEQFALPEAIGTLRRIRRTQGAGALVSVSAADPLNLVGILTPGARVPAAPANRVLYEDGVPTAVLEAGETRLLVERDEPRPWVART